MPNAKPFANYAKVIIFHCFTLSALPHLHKSSHSTAAAMKYINQTLGLMLGSQGFLDTNMYALGGNANQVVQTNPMQEECDLVEYRLYSDVLLCVIMCHFAMQQTSKQCS